jgi:hypothetical protein
MAVWEAQFGQEDDLDADGNHDGQVDGLDFLAMQRNHGASAAQSSATVASAAASTAEQLSAAQSAGGLAQPLSQPAELSNPSPAIDVAYFVNPLYLRSGQTGGNRSTWRPAPRAEYSPTSRPADLERALDEVEFYRRGRSADVVQLAATLPIDAEVDVRFGTSSIDRYWAELDETPSDSLTEAIAEMLRQ